MQGSGGRLIRNTVDEAVASHAELASAEKRMGRKQNIIEMAFVDPALHRIQYDQSPELDRCAALVPRDDTCVRLEQADQLLRRGHLLAPEHPPFGLADDALDKGDVPRDRALEVIDLLVRGHVP